MLWLMRSNEDLDSLDILSYFIKASKRKNFNYLLYKILGISQFLWVQKPSNINFASKLKSSSFFFSFVTPASANISCFFVLFALKELKLLIDFFGN